MPHGPVRAGATVAARLDSMPVWRGIHGFGTTSRASLRRPP